MPKIRKVRGDPLTAPSIPAGRGICQLGRAVLCGSTRILSEMPEFMCIVFVPEFGVFFTCIGFTKGL